MKKGIFKKILPLMILGIILSLSPLFLRVNASSGYFRIDTQGVYGELLFFEPNESNINIRDYFIRVDGLTNETISASVVNGQIILNNNNNYILELGKSYALLYQNGINHFIFYVIDYTGYGISSSDYYLTELFTISFGTRNTNYFDIDGLVVQSYVPISSVPDPANIIANYWFFFENTMKYEQLIHAYNNRYNSGYANGYNAGYVGGQAGESAISPFLSLLSGIWNGVDSVLQIEIVPYIKLWYFIAIPLFFIVIWGVLKIWRHN